MTKAKIDKTLKTSTGIYTGEQKVEFNTTSTELEVKANQVDFVMPLFLKVKELKSITKLDDSNPEDVMDILGKLVDKDDSWKIDELYLTELMEIIPVWMEEMGKRLPSATVMNPEDGEEEEEETLGK